MTLSSVEHALGFTSSRAGVGKTTLVVELAAWFAERDYSVALLDADLTAPDALGRLGIEGSGGRSAGLPCFSIGRALEEHGLAGIAGELLEQELARLLEEQVEFGRVELLLVDLAPGAEQSERWLAALGLDALVHVTLEGDERAPEAPLPLLGRIETFAREGQGARGPRGATLLGRIPFDARLRESAGSGRPLVLHDGHSPAAQALAKTGANLWKRVRSRLSG